MKILRLIKKTIHFSLRVLKRTLLRNYYGISNERAIKHRVNLEYAAKLLNLGDLLSPIVIKYVLSLKGLSLDTPVKKTKHLFAIGSIIGWAFCDRTVWGSGMLSFGGIHGMGTTLNIYKPKYDIRAVRGPVTKSIMESFNIDCPEVYGDPAIFMPLIYKKPEIQKKYKVSVVQHHSFDREYDSSLHMIDIKTDDYSHFIDEICASEKIVTQSLHGLILAETYGVPAVFVIDGMEKSMLKFYDWYYSTNRYSVKVARNVQEGVEMTPMPLPENLDKLRDNLLKAFPYDLWTENRK